MTARSKIDGRVLAGACQLGIAVSWLALLLQSGPDGHPWSLPGSTMNGRELALCAVTMLGAVSCFARAATRAAQRTAWALLAGGLAGYASGFVIIFYVRAGGGAGPFGLNLSDCASLALYPLAFAGLAALTHPQRRRGELSATLDGAVAALAVGAVTVAIVAVGHPRLFHGAGLKVVYALAYPVGSLTLLAGALTGLALLRWRFDARWLLLVAGFGALAVGDCIYAVRSADGQFAFGTWLDALYAAGPALVGFAAWRAPRKAQAATGRSAIVLTISGVATLAALTVLVTDHTRRLPALAVGLASAGIFLSVARTALYLRQDRLFQRAQRDALTDELTGLPNRRAMYRLLNERLAAKSPTTLLLIDLDGFKAVNDTLGHAAGDELLVGTAARLMSVGGLEHVARIGGDEFAVVLAGVSATGEVFAGLVRTALEQPMVIDGATVAVGASVGFASGTADGVEALARWQHPARGLLGPAEFLPAAERAGLLGALTRARLGRLAGSGASVR